MVTPIKPCYCSGQIYIVRGPWHFEDFRDIFQPNIGKNQKSLTIWARNPLLVLCHIMVNPALVTALRS